MHHSLDDALSFNSSLFFIHFINKRMPTSYTMEQILADNTILKNLLKFQCSEFSAESILFLLAVKDYKAGPKKRKALAIYDCFCADVSGGGGLSVENREGSMPINVPAQIITTLSARIQQIRLTQSLSSRIWNRRAVFSTSAERVPPIDLFDAAVKSIEKMLEADVLKRFNATGVPGSYMTDQYKITINHVLKKLKDATIAGTDAWLT